MTTQPHPLSGTGGVPELEHQELDRRLRSLAWPAAPPDVKRRCLRAVLTAVDGGPASPAPEPAAPRGDGRLATGEQSRNGRDPRRIDRIERAQRYELTRWEPRLRQIGWAAPRRQPRFAAVL